MGAGLRGLCAEQDRAERKKKLKPLGRTVGKIAHAAPLAVMEAIVMQVATFSHCVESPLSQGVLVGRVTPDRVSAMWS